MPSSYIFNSLYTSTTFRFLTIETNIIKGLYWASVLRWILRQMYKLSVVLPFGFKSKPWRFRLCVYVMKNKKIYSANESWKTSMFTDKHRWPDFNFIWLWSCVKFGNSENKYKHSFFFVVFQSPKSIMILSMNNLKQDWNLRGSIIQALSYFIGN